MERKLAGRSSKPPEPTNLSETNTKDAKPTEPKSPVHRASPSKPNSSPAKPTPQKASPGKVTVPRVEELWISFEELFTWETEGEQAFEGRKPKTVGEVQETQSPLGVVSRWLRPVMQEFEWLLARAAADMTLRQNLANRVPLELSYQPARWDLF